MCNTCKENINEIKSTNKTGPITNVIEKHYLSTETNLKELGNKLVTIQAAQDKLPQEVKNILDINKQDKISYAYTTKIPKSGIMSNYCNLTIKPTIPQEFEITKGDIINSINPANLRISVKHIKYIKDGLVINSTMENLQKLKEEIIKTFKNKYTVTNHGSK